jgi:phosphate uptake regulator
MPISWIRKNKLGAGSEIQISETDQGDLLISSDRKTNVLTKDEILTIKVDGKDSDQINLEILLAYIRDYVTIVLDGKEIASKSQNIINSLQNLIGIDIIEQSEYSITIKNFFSLDKETSPTNLLRKINIVNRASFKLLESFFDHEFTQEDVFGLQKFEKQNERLFILINKSILKLITDPGLMKDIQTNYLQVSKDNMFAQAFSHISLDLLSLGKSFLFLDNKSKDSALLRKNFDMIYKNYDNVVNSIINRDIEKIKPFIKDFEHQNRRLDEFLKNLEDTPMIQATGFLIAINFHIRDLAFTALT